MSNGIKPKSSVSEKEQNEKKVEWFDKTGKLKLSLLDEGAKKEAEKWTEGLQGKKLEEGKSQVRKYFNEVKNIQREFQNLKAQNSNDTKDNWTPTLIRIKRLKAQVVYDSNRDNSKLPPKFADFLQRCVNSINEEGDFEAFLLHFEACLGFFYGEKGEKKGA